MTFDANSFKIVYGANQEEIEIQVEKLLPEGYVLHGAIVAQPNAQFSKESAASQSPYLYYQILARQKQTPSPPQTQQAPAEEV
ncbi:hypothetical protein [Cesiribacter andamanensis]|uniref:DUF1737 domain-containing protein n=1 Tax=Cesiribacter andamanensis AMV16 TaxID=1279009 RepID=M7NNM8_9BACT|nr:hypothetical protein [Cesiribacter andamanensis]EMR03310.1 hypothetical protein ADICEAN_01564 [Cesiribacter andamanensis AMV16]